MKTNLKITMSLCVGALWVLLFAPVAKAGQWVVAGYEYSKQEHQEEQTYGRSILTGPIINDSGFSRIVTTTDGPGFREYSTDPNYNYTAYGSIDLYKTDHYSGLVPGPYRYFPGEASATVSITPVFKWEPNLIYDGDNPEGSPDPNDPPPQKLWYYEEGSAYASRTASTQGQSYSAQSPYDGRHFSLVELNDGFGSEIKELDGAPYYSTVDNHASKSQVREQAAGDYTVRGETRTLSATVTTTGAALISNDSREVCYAAVSLSYEVDTISFDIISRLKGDHDETDLTTDLNASGYYPPSTANIAAGGFVTGEHEHEADIVMRIKRRHRNFGFGSPLSGISRGILPRLRIHNREGVEKPAISSDGAGSTDSDGRVLSDTLTSRDLETHGGAGGEMGVSFTNDDAPARPIYMSWGRVEWRMGEAGDKQWNTRFLLLGGDYTETAWVKVSRFVEEDEDKPLLDHTMKLTVERLRVREKDDETGEWKTTLYTTSASEAGQYSNNGDEGGGIRVVHQQDLTGEVSRFISLPGAMSDSGQGVYKGAFTVHKLADVEIDELNLALEDQGVYRPVN